MVPQSKIWDRARVDAEKQLIQEHLEPFLERGDYAGRLQEILSKIAELEHETSEISQLNRFIYIVCALAHHARFGGLRLRYVERLVALAKAILKVNGILPSKCKLSNLYVDLYSILSHSYRSEGIPFKAAWEQRVCQQFVHKSLTKTAAFQALSNAIFALRLGHAALALAEIDRAEKIGLLPTHVGRLRIEKLRALRLLCQFEEANKLTNDTIQNVPLSQCERREILWEQICRHAQQTKDISHLVAAVRPGKQFNEAVYVQEAFLWTRIVENRRWLEQFKTHKQLGRISKVKYPSTGYMRDCVKVIECCYDYSFPLIYRLDEVGVIVQNTDRLVSIDKTLLVLLSVLRWLTRSKAHGLASLVWEQYKGISYRLTEGRLSDVLGFAPDWFVKSESPSLKAEQSEAA